MLTGGFSQRVSGDLIIIIIRDPVYSALDTATKTKV